MACSDFRKAVREHKSVVGPANKFKRNPMGANETDHGVPHAARLQINRNAVVEHGWCGPRMMAR
jgi:hypothetical protein